jgi:hypothetical protein
VEGFSALARRLPGACPSFARRLPGALPDLFVLFNNILPLDDLQRKQEPQVRLVPLALKHTKI